MLATEQFVKHVFENQLMRSVVFDHGVHKQCSATYLAQTKVSALVYLQPNDTQSVVLLALVSASGSEVKYLGYHLGIHVPADGG